MNPDQLHCTFCEQPVEASLKIERDGLPFCCTGCATAHALVQGDAQIGPSATLVQKYAHLEAAQQAEGYVQYNSTHAQWDVQLPNIHCTSCLILLEKMNTWLPGIWDVRVQFSAKTATVSFNPERVPISMVAAWLDFVGYPPSLTTKERQQRSEITRLGVAGFAMGNAMMSAFPEYFGLDQEGFAALLFFFRYSTAFFATLSLIYSGKSYLQGAYKAVRTAQWSLDIPIALGMLALWFWSAYLLLLGHNGGYFDSLSGLIFFLLLGKWLQGRTYGALSFERTVSDFLPIAVFSEDHQAFVRLEQLTRNTCIQVPREGIVPANAELLEPATVDYSFITGESDPQQLNPGDTVLLGAKNLGHTLRAKVTEAPQTKNLEQLWREDHLEQTGWVSPRITATFTLSVLLLALGGGAAWFFIAPHRVLEIAVSVLIIACPCALSLAAPFAFGTASAVLAKQGLFLKSGKSVAHLADTSEIFWDKTGTLTPSRNKGHYSLQPQEKDDLALLRAGLSRSSHPMSRAMLASLPTGPHLSINDWVETVGAGISFSAAPDLQFRIGSGAWLGLPLGPTYVVKNEKVIGKFEPGLNYRTHMEPVFSALVNLGLRHTLVSGDRPRTLPQEWEGYFAERTYFEHDPKQKMELVQLSSHTLYIGDGLNDLEAIAAAHLGLAIVEETLGYFPQSDGVLYASALPQLPNMVRYARRMRSLVRLAYALSLLYNIVGLSFALMGALSPVVAAVLMPLSSVSVVLFSAIGAHLLKKF